MRAQVPTRGTVTWLLTPMPDRPEIPDALREAVERTVQATVETRGKAQGRWRRERTVQATVESARQGRAPSTT